MVLFPGCPPVRRAVAGEGRHGHHVLHVQLGAEQATVRAVGRRRVSSGTGLRQTAHGHPSKRDVYCVQEDVPANIQRRRKGDTTNHTAVRDERHARMHSENAPQLAAGRDLSLQRQPVQRCPALLPSSQPLPQPRVQPAVDGTRVPAVRSGRHAQLSARDHCLSRLHFWLVC